MAYNTPQQATAAAVGVGTKKAKMSIGEMLVGGFLAGAYIAFGGLLAIAVSSGLDPKTWGTLPTLVTGGVFALGLILVIVAGSELLTGNMALVPLAFFRRKAGLAQVAGNLTWVLIGNLLGSLFVAYFLAIKTGVIGSHGADPATAGGMTYERLRGIVEAKGHDETGYQIFLRAVGCNWLVSLGVWMALAAKDIAGKIIAIWFPIMAFVALGFDHVVANFFFLPAGIFAHVPGLGWDDALRNWVFAFCGNLVGAVVFVAGAYWYLHLRGRSDEELSIE
jgi:formate transporter